LLDFEEFSFDTVSKLDKGCLASFFLEELIVMSVDKAGLESYGICNKFADQNLVDFLEIVELQLTELINHITRLYERDVESLHFRGSLHLIL
jgi:hypothetical protein